MPAATGALATFFAELLLGLLGQGPRALASWAVPAVASAAIAVLVVANVLGARLGAAIQGALTFVKVAALLLVMAVAFLLSDGGFAHLVAASHVEIEAGALGRAAASVIWAYDGWIAVSMIAGEVVAAERQMRRIIISGMLAIVPLYLGANVAYFYALPVEAMAETPGGVPQRIVSEAVGSGGAVLLGLFILCSVFGALNGNVLRRGGVVRPPLRGRSGLRPAAEDTWRGAALPHAGLPLGARGLPRRHLDGAYEDGGADRPT